MIAANRGLICAEILAFVECWEPLTGDPLWSRPTDFADWLLIADDRLILGAESGWTALDGTTGEELWRAPSTRVDLRESRGWISRSPARRMNVWPSTWTTGMLRGGPLYWSPESPLRMGKPFMSARVKMNLRTSIY